MSVLLEVCVDSVASVVAAEQGGAQRVELCGSLADGGITPSAGLIAMARKRVALPLHVLIRPRTGDFCYSPDEFEVMKRDIVLAKQLGANGIALGVLLPNRRVDVPRTSELVQLARPLSVTFHRAFDATPDLRASLESVVGTGADRILTSGGCQTAEQGSAILAELVKLAGKRIILLACGHIREQNVAELLKATGVHEVHANLRSPVPSMKHAAEHDPAAVIFEDPARFEVVPGTIARFLDAAVGVQAEK